MDPTEVQLDLKHQLFNGIQQIMNDISGVFYILYLL